MLGFRRTLEIIARTLREVVNRVFVCLFVCLFVWVKPENLYFAPCVWREVITPGISSLGITGYGLNRLENTV